MSDLASSRVFLVASMEVSSHFSSHAQKHAGSVACVYECIPSLNFKTFLENVTVVKDKGWIAG